MLEECSVEKVLCDYPTHFLFLNPNDRYVASPQNDKRGPTKEYLIKRAVKAKTVFETIFQLGCSSKYHKQEDRTYPL